MMVRLLRIQYPGAVHHLTTRLTQAVRRTERQSGGKLNQIKRELEWLESL
jgi:hypothetical protein